MDRWKDGRTDPILKDPSGQGRGSKKNITGNIKPAWEALLKWHTFC